MDNWLANPIAHNYQLCTRYVLDKYLPRWFKLKLVKALLAAIGHYIYCLKLNQRPVDSSVPQSWNSFISLAFARVFSVLLATSASAAFTQLLWRYFRSHHLSVSKIDALFSLNTGPLKLYRLDLLLSVPVLWTFGLFFALIPIATLFPPGALEVNLLAYSQKSHITVPTLNIDYHGNGSAVAFFQNAMFTSGFDGEYRWVSRNQNLNTALYMFESNT